ncbi:ATP-dependent RNA helicase YqfR [Staphylococcus aureus]|uniref:ATP-dependent RNA helicase YqfR n=1 Tax=Staphylococcus aureus TaxID=1280 RepID=A0A380E3H1_STAAU|nr:ATP-dependent RNA helicase YqfR [Staphylococcus aureus]
MHLASYLVIDEADLMIDLGLIEDVDYIAARLEDNANIAVFSAQFHNSYNHF